MIHIIYMYIYICIHVAVGLLILVVRTRRPPGGMKFGLAVFDFQHHRPLSRAPLQGHGGRQDSETDIIANSLARKAPRAGGRVPEPEG